MVVRIESVAIKLLEKIIQMYAITAVVIFLPCISCLAALARTSRTALNTSDDSWCPCLLLDVKRKAFKDTPLSVMPAKCVHLRLVLSY